MLQDQPFKVLALLLRRPGEVVTREELQQALWPADTFVEFDESLNKVIQKVRQALGDSSDNPRFIETIPRRGYRFIAPVEVPEQGESEGEADARNRPEPKSALEAYPDRGRRPRRQSILWIVAAPAALAVGIAIWIVRPNPAPPPLRKFTIAPKAEFGEPVISPDGRHIAYVAGGSIKETSQPVGTAPPERLWIWDLDRGEPREIDGTDGAHPWPFWSSDSEFVTIGARRHLWKVPLEKGGPSPICELSDLMLGGTWSPDGRSIIYSILHQGIYEVSAGGGAAKMLIPVDRSTGGDHFDTPYLLPARGTDRTLLYASQTSGAVHDIVLHSLESGRRSVLAENALNAVYSASGHVLYGQITDGLEVIMALPFSVATMKPAGDAFRVARNSLAPSVSRDGTLVYPTAEGWPRIQLSWHDRRGHKIAPVGSSEAIENISSLSPDGRSVAFTAFQSMRRVIWVLDVIRGTKARLTFSPKAEANPVWSPTGKEIAFCSNRQKFWDIYTSPVDGSGEAKVLVSGPLVKILDDWSPDGRYLVYEMEDPKTGHDLWYLKKTQDGSGYESVAFLRTPAQEGQARFSPDGQYLAYASNECGRSEVYVRRFPDGSGKQQVSVNGGSLPSWRKDGKELFYLDGETLVSVSLATKPVLSIGEPRRLFTDSGLTGTRLSSYFSSDDMYSVSADGQRFLFPEASGPVPPRVIQVIENWSAEFRDKPKADR